MEVGRWTFIKDSEDVGPPLNELEKVGSVQHVSGEDKDGVLQKSTIFYKPNKRN